MYISLQYERETQKMMDDLADATRLHDDERKRQQWLVRQKREKQVKAHQEAEVTNSVDGKASDRVSYKPDKY